MTYKMEKLHYYKTAKSSLRFLHSSWIIIICSLNNFAQSIATIMTPTIFLISLSAEERVSEIFPWTTDAIFIATWEVQTTDRVFTLLINFFDRHCHILSHILVAKKISLEITILFMCCRCSQNYWNLFILDVLWDAFVTKQSGQLVCTCAQQKTMAFSNQHRSFCWNNSLFRYVIPISLFHFSCRNCKLTALLPSNIFLTLNQMNVFSIFSNVFLFPSDSRLYWENDLRKRWTICSFKQNVLEESKFTLNWSMQI